MQNNLILTEFHKEKIAISSYYEIAKINKL